MKPNGTMNWRSMATGVGGGAVLLLIAAQIMAKPSAPVVARAAQRPASERPRASAPPRAAPRKLAVAAAPPLRELFAPLVAEKKQETAPPAKPAPVLPPAGRGVAPATPAAPAAPAGPSVRDFQMLGVVEMDGGPRVLLKSTSLGQSRYFAKGEVAWGFTVGEIRDSEVTLAREGKTEQVAMSSAVTIEGPGSASTASSSGFSRFGGPGGDRSRFGGDRSGGFGGDRSSRGGDRGNSGGSGGNGGGSRDSGFSTADIMSLPTWADRLKKLEEVKAQLEPDRYERLKKFMTDRAAQEKK